MPSSTKSGPAGTPSLKPYVPPTYPLWELRRPGVKQAGHRYDIGDRLVLLGALNLSNRERAFCSVVARLPYEGRGAMQYRVRSEAENYDRIVNESDLQSPEPQKSV